MDLSTANNRLLNKLTTGRMRTYARRAAKQGKGRYRDLLIKSLNEGATKEGVALDNYLQLRCKQVNLDPSALDDLAKPASSKKPSIKATPTGKWEGWFDGASLMNPGPSAYGYVIRDPKGIEVAKSAQYIGKGTNNEAEYRGLIALLVKAKELGAENIHIYGDSKLIVKQLEGKWEVNAENLKSHHAHAFSIVKALSAKVIWVPREQNKHADKLSKEGLGVFSELDVQSRKNDKNTRKPKNIWVNQTDIADALGMDTIEFGALLDKVGMRLTKSKRPTLRAVDEGAALYFENNFGMQHRWHSTELIRVLKELGALPV